MLIVLPSTPTTQKASEFLHTRGVLHHVIPMPDSLGYKTGSDIGLYLPEGSQRSTEEDIPMLLTRERFVVMRVFKDFTDARHE